MTKTELGDGEICGTQCDPYSSVPNSNCTICGKYPQGVGEREGVKQNYML